MLQQLWSISRQTGTTQRERSGILLAARFAHDWGSYLQDVPPNSVSPPVLLCSLFLYLRWPESQTQIQSFENEVVFIHHSFDKCFNINVFSGDPRSETIVRPSLPYGQRNVANSWWWGQFPIYTIMKSVPKWAKISLTIKNFPGIWSRR